MCTGSHITRDRIVRPLRARQKARRFGGSTVLSELVRELLRRLLSFRIPSVTVKCKEERLNAVGAVAQPLKSGSALPQADSGLFGGALAYCRGYPAPREVTRAGPVKLEIEV